jgi:hypothetical protein
MSTKVKNVVAGIFVCAVSSTAVASQSVKEENRSEEVMKTFSQKESKVVAPILNEELLIITPSSEVAVKEKPGTGKKRHIIIDGNALSDWWDSLWATTKPTAKQDKYFS